MEKGIWRAPQNRGYSRGSAGVHLRAAPAYLLRRCMEEREISGGGAICWSMGARLAILGTRGFFELPVQRVKNSCQIEYLIQQLGQVEPTVAKLGKVRSRDIFLPWWVTP